MKRFWIALAACFLMAATAQAALAGGTLSLPEALTTLEAEAFQGVEGADAVVVPEGVTRIPARAFKDAKFAEIRLPATVTAIDASAFENCGPGRVTRYYFPMPALGITAPFVCSARITLGGVEPANLTCAVGEDGSATITSLSGDAEKLAMPLVVPASVGGARVTAIGGGAFRDRAGLTAVELPSSLTGVGDNAFRNCDGLIEITIPEGVTAIGKSAFESCDALTTAKLPSTLLTLGEGAFNDCYALTRADLPAGLTEIGAKAFRYTALTEADIPQGASLGSEVFSNCKALTRVSLPDAMTAIPDWTFYNCVKLAQVDFPQGLTAIGQSAFSGAYYRQAGVAVYELPDTLSTLGENAFNGCGAALCVTREGSVEALMKANGLTFTRYGETDFRYRYAGATVGEETVYTLTLTGYAGGGGAVTIPAGPAIIGESAFSENAAITAVTIPEGVTTIDRWAFYRCPELASVHLPDSLTTVMNAAFRYDAKLTDVNFPDGLTALKSDAFADTCAVAGTHYYALPDHLAECDGYVFYNTGAVLSLARDSDTEALIRQSQDYLFAYADAPDFTYKMGYYGSGLQLGLYGYLGSASPLRLPDDCEAVRYDGFIDRVDGGLICAPLSDTDAALSRAQLNHTFPGHEDVRYRVIDGVLYVMGWAGKGATADIPRADAYIAAGWDEQIRSGAFAGNETLEKLVVPEGVTRVNADACNGCVNLTDITLPDSLKAIDQKAFLNCGKNLDAPFYLTLPDHLEELSGRNGGANAFEDTNAVLVCAKTSQTAALVSDQNYVYTCPGEYDYRYRYETYPYNSDAGRQLWLVGYEGEGPVANIPKGVYGLRLFSNNTTAANWPTFHAYGFYGNEAVTKVVIPEGVVDIRSDVFTNCYNLTDITFPSTLKNLDQNVFRWCGRDAAKPFYFILPDEMESMVGRGGGAQTFSDCNAILQTGKYSKTAELLTDRNFCYTVAGERDFRYRYLSYTEGEETGRRLWLVGYAGGGGDVAIPSGIYGISRYQWDAPYGTYEPDFVNRKDITGVIIPDGVSVISHFVFQDCKLLTDITMPDTLTYIGQHAFENVGASAGKRFIVVIPSGVKDYTGANGAGWSPFNGSGATLVAARNTVVAGELYDHDWMFYYSVADAEAGLTHIVFKPHDDPDYHYFGNP